MNILNKYTVAQYGGDFRGANSVKPDDVNFRGVNGIKTDDSKFRGVNGVKPDGSVNFCGAMIPAYYLSVGVIGSGAAGLCCAGMLRSLGCDDVAVITEGLNMGTSRNTGSDKQTYYKLTLSGKTPDSVYDMAKSYFDCTLMHGDLALVEAAYSPRAFYRLCELGVPFPANEYGEYVGYRTDHDERTRATSCGPLTSRYMTQALERDVMAKNIRIFDGCRVVHILTENGEACGVIAACEDAADAQNPRGLCAFVCGDTVYAVGGPSAIYASTVYPESQSCALGTAFLAGAEGVNLTESQYGIASLRFRWNLSGSYQQVVPRYYSVGADGVERDFLRDAIPDDSDRFTSIFLKGYQWPFDPAKLGGSSRCDLAVYGEIQSCRRVFIDYTRNPDGFDLSLLSCEGRDYLTRSGALGETPYKRLSVLNDRAAALYLEHGIDISREPLEIGVCAQHNNGGLAGDINYQSTSLAHFYPIGEANGVFGVRRPGGSALNSTQVSAIRAAEHIAPRARHAEYPASEQHCPLMSLTAEPMPWGEILRRRIDMGRRMDKAGAFIRRPSEVSDALQQVKESLGRFFDDYSAPDRAAFIQCAINYDILLTQYVYLSAINEYICVGGVSRGSYLIPRDEVDKTIRAEITDKLCYASLHGGEVNFRYEAARPIPDSEQWFETVYNSFRR